MNTELQHQEEKSEVELAQEISPEINRKINQAKESVVLCDHCQRTATNGIKCQGICVADSAY